MSKDEIISNVLDGLSRVQNFLNNSDIEIFLKTDKSGNKIKKSKKFIDDLFDLSKNIKESFYELYSKYEIEETQECEKNNLAVPNSRISNGLISSNNLGNGDSNSQDDEDIFQNAESIDENMVTSIDDDMDPSFNKTTELNTDNETEILHIDPSEDQNFKVENMENEHPRIRLVDLNKLIDPDKHKKSVKFDTSVIILSSSDDEKVINSKETKTDSVSEKINFSKKQKPDSFESGKSNHKKNIDDIDSDIELDKNSRKSRRLKNVQKLKSNIKEKYRQIETRKKRKERSKNTAHVEVISDSSSDSETEKQQRKSTRIRLGRSNKMDDIKLHSKVYVPLPLFQCQKLKEVYNRNKEYFDIISPEKRESLRRSKRTRNKVENESSSDADESQIKKTKATIIDGEDSQSDDAKLPKKSLKKRKRDVEKDIVNRGDSDEGRCTKTKTKTISAENSDSDENTRKEDKLSNKNLLLKKDAGGEKRNKKLTSTKETTNCNNVDLQEQVDHPLNRSNSDSENEMSNERTLKTSKNQNDEKSHKKNISIKSAKTTKDSANGKTSDYNEESTEKILKHSKSGIHVSEEDEEQEEPEIEQDPLAVDDPLSTENDLPEHDQTNRETSVNKDTIKDSADEDKSEESHDDNDVEVLNKKDKGIEDESIELKNKRDEDKGTERGDCENLDSEDENKREKKNEKTPQQSDISDDEESTNKNTDKKIMVSSDSDEGFGAFSKKRGKTTKELIRKAKKKMKVVVSDSDNSENDEKDKEDTEKEVQSISEESDKPKEDSDDKKKKSRRKRIKRTKDSSSDSDEEVATRKNIRKVLDKNSLSETTKQAEAEEKERKARIAEKQKKYNHIFEEKKDAKIDKVVLDYDAKTKEPLLEVHKKIVKHLKPHQASGIQFMYDACFESVERLKDSQGSGCILAHCMGLGKTLQVISLVHTLIVNSNITKVHKAMVVCPINTVLNWKSEFKKWVPNSSPIDVYELATPKKNYERQYTISEWNCGGGVLILGYNMFRLLSNPNNKKITKKMRTAFVEGMVDPGPDIVICDEGHLLKNEKTNLSIAMNRIKTARRIVLTGTPLQNNLKEYWCMVQFIKPNLLGTYKEYMNRFVNPITNGQYTDSTKHDIDLMRKRSHVLHKLLDGVVQRRDYAVLEPYLPPKHEYVLFLKLSDVQVKLYRHYIEHYARKNDGSNRTSFLFADFQELQRICTHPRVLKDRSVEKKEKWDDEEESEGSLKDFIDDGELSTHSTSSSNSNSEEDSSHESESEKKKKKPRMTRARAAQKKDDNADSSDSDIEEVSKEWWQEFCDGDELDNIKNSGKLSLLFEILKECEEIGDKVLVFSQSLNSLNCIEYFLAKIDEATEAGDTEKMGYKGSWSLGLDYFRLDGSSSCDNRAYWCDSFNNPDNVRARLFLISTKAGGLGINLVAANRVIIFDVSWNPSHDIQSIYRVYRFGQLKPSYIYRFVTYGAMEMKIYERQVTKQAISKRVIDEQQIDRHYNQNDLQELYKCDLEPTERPLPMVPKDVLLGEMLQKYENIIFKYHLHQSLLENKQDEGLNEEERKAAWEEFENEKVLRKTTTSTNAFFVQAYGNAAGFQNMSAAAINAALMNIVRRDNPTWSEQQIKGIIPALVRQLQVQIEEQDMSMYQRVVQEIQIMNQTKLKESLYQQHMMKYYQQQYLYQKQQQAVLGNLNINPQTLQSLYGQSNYYPGNTQQFLNGPSTSSNTSRRPTGEIIDLND
ncbi:transcriptional regulator ATRX homolog isoform X1 [Diorhabda sublineata]|uniref:transcriptional regulator ATRX homolog isoform X1 n=1 Tax=Diorhabda sublineata TaxID=1163346 RepID=UPI0024E18E84|nr:transcriptional regulator ATRX homolog isoform X1 [Diorhabda sublineata]